MNAQTAVTNERSLDLFSTSPTKEDFALLNSLETKPCDYGAPYFHYLNELGLRMVVQGCCNHWDCGRCGMQRAKHEYGRIVNGVTKLAEDQSIQFITITCRGSQITRSEADSGYLQWTNRFLDAARAKAKRAGQKWVYVQVTERQKRGHPHSHILTTFDPLDLSPGYVEKWKRDNAGNLRKIKVPALRSNWLAAQVVKSGLGEQYDVSVVVTAAAASRYVAKYMFKETAFKANWPKGWKRVRYSLSFPKLEKRSTDAAVLLSRQDWYNLAKLAAIVYTPDLRTWREVAKMLKGHDTLVR